MIYVASEVGVLGDVITNADNIVAKGRLGPGARCTGVSPLARPLARPQTAQRAVRRLQQAPVQLAKQHVPLALVCAGQMVCADLTKATFMETGAISKEIATRKPYKEWLASSLRRLSDLGESTFLNEPMYDAATLLRMQSSIGEGGRGAWARAAAAAYTFEGRNSVQQAG
jgi:glutamate synthase (ferredoxin)